MKYMPLTLASGSVLAALVLGACGSSDSAGSGSSSGSEPITLQVGYTPISSIGAIVLGEEQGFFKDEGLALKLTQIDNPPAGVAAVAGGQMEFSYAPSIPIINAAANGVKIKIVAAADGNEEGTLAAVKANPSEASKFDGTGVVVRDPAITSPGQLAGKMISVPARGAQLEVTIANAIKEDGGDPKTVEWITLDFPGSVSALADGRIDAAGLVQPFLNKAKSEGGRNVVSPGVLFFGDGAVGMWVTSDKYAKDNSQTVTKFQRAVAKSNEYGNAHLEEVQQAAATFLKIDINVLKAGSEPYFPAKVTTEDVNKVVTKLDTLGYLKSPFDTANLVIPQS